MRLTNQSGSFLVLLLALVALGSIFFAASLRLVLNSQKLVATKARLDICAVRMAASRERFFRNLNASNDYVYSTLIATYVARGLMIVPFVGPYAAIGQRGGAVANRAAARGQELLIAKQAIAEAKLTLCEKTPFSEQLILCHPSPLFVKKGLRRNKALFSDLFHFYEWRQKDLGSVTCRLAENPLLRTTLKLKGNPRLTHDEFSDVYTN